MNLNASAVTCGRSSRMSSCSVLISILVIFGIVPFLLRIAELHSHPNDLPNDLDVFRGKNPRRHRRQRMGQKDNFLARPRAPGAGISLPGLDEVEIGRAHV